MAGGVADEPDQPDQPRQAEAGGTSPASAPSASRGGVVHVAGGRGFLGAAVVRALQRAGMQVSASGREGIPPDERPRVTTLIWCAGSRAAALAALWHAHIEAPLAAAGALPALRSMIYVSSAEVYGTQPVPYPETAPRLGASAYARAKIYGEDALASLCWQRGVALAIARPSVIYGPGQAPSMLIPEAIDRLARGQPLLTTTGAQTRDWIFVDDAAEAIAAIAAQGGHRAYNLGSGEERTVRQMLELLAALLGEDAAAQIRWGARPYRDDETMRYALSIARARAELGWTPSVPLALGLARCVTAARHAASEATNEAANAAVSQARAVDPVASPVNAAIAPSRGAPR